MSRSLSYLQAVVLGLVFLTASGLAVAGLFAVGATGWYGGGSLHVRVAFAEVRGVEVGTRVRIQGIDAGEVVRIDVPDGPHDPVILRLRIKKEHRHLVRASSTVQIVSEGMLGARVLEIRPPAQRSGQTPTDMSLATEDTLLVGEKTPDLDAVLAQASAVLDGVQNGEGTLGKLAKDPEAYNSLVSLLRNGNDAVDQGKATMGAVQRTAEGVQKSSWLGHVDDPLPLLVRPAARKDRRTFSEADLFEPGRAVLTAAGRKKLDDLRAWLKSFEDRNPEVVVVSYADPTKKGDPRLAQIVTKLQSEAVVEHLRKSGAYRVGWFSSYKVAPPLGMGTQVPPETEREPLPSARIEVVVFVPQT